MLTGDFNNDGKMDIYVACDQTPPVLYINQGDGTFQEEALLRDAAMDATASVYDGNGWLDIFPSNFSDERESLDRNDRDGDFKDGTQSAGRWNG